MLFSVEIENKIKSLFENDDELREKLLSGDADAVRYVGRISQRGINPDDVIVAFESNDPETLNYLYKRAKKLCELQDLYRELCLEFCKINKVRVGREK